MSPATVVMLRKLLEGMRAMCDSCLALIGPEEEPVPERKPRFMGDTDGQG